MYDAIIRIKKRKLEGGAPKGCHHKAVCAMPKTTRRSHASMKILHALKII
jgi:hypothetical protein